MTAVEFSFTNQGSSNLTDIRIGGRQLASGMSIHEFPAIPILYSGGTSTVTLGINFNDTTQTAKFDITLTEEDGGKRCHGVSIDDNITLKFAGRTVATKSLVLISMKYQCDEPQSAEILVNCEKMVVGGLLL